MPYVPKSVLLTGGILFVLIGASVWYVLQSSILRQGAPSQKIISLSSTMILESSAFVSGGMILAKYTCDGANVHPALIIQGVPLGVKSLVLIMDDPDAPQGIWVHWVLWNIAPDTREIQEGTVPVGAVEGMTSFGRSGYGGPCPPSGTHHYIFKLYALNKTLAFLPSGTARDIEAAMQGNIQDQATLIGLYARGK